MIEISQIVSFIDEFAPLSFQEPYDNSGFLVGNLDEEAKGILVTLDITMPVIDEAISLGCNLIISHHPIIFSPIKSISASDTTGRMIIHCIQNGISIYAAHTNADSVKGGVNFKIAEKIGLTNVNFLSSSKMQLIKLVTFSPFSHAHIVREALFNAGAGHIGNYDQCSFNSKGEGTFRALENTNPYVGEKNLLHHEKEVRIEVILPEHIKNKVIQSLISVHPYEEVAYDIYPLLNKNNFAGIGVVGDLKNPMKPLDFLKQLKEVFNAENIKYTNPADEKILRVAVCGGSGSFLLKEAIQSGAQAFVSADFKYHQFFEGEDKIMIADIGHYESEQFTKEIFYDILTKNLSNFAVHLSKIDTNPVKYL